MGGSLVSHGRATGGHGRVMGTPNFGVEPPTREPAAGHGRVMMDKSESWAAGEAVGEAVVRPTVRPGGLLAMAES